MKTLAEVFVDVLSEREKPLVRVDSKGRTAVVLDPKTQASNRRVETNRGEVKPGHMLRNKDNTWERGLFVHSVKEREPHPRHGGRQIEVQASHAGKLFASDKPVAGYSSRRPDDASYVPPKRLVPTKTIILSQHPDNGGRWVGGGYTAVVPKGDQKTRTIKKRPGYGGF